jgi:hypothetical protein
MYIDARPSGRGCCWAVTSQRDVDVLVRRSVGVVRGHRWTRRLQGHFDCDDDGCSLQVAGRSSQLVASTDTRVPELDNYRFGTLRQV